ncbi:MAG: pilus assembly protein [Rhizobiales bacterium]|nr:pilus assembly protein [Hyphomicrobiales bacterium]
MTIHAKEGASALSRRKVRHALKGSDGQQGAGAIEFALIVPFLLVLIVGIVEMSNIYFMRNQLGEIVREATRRLAVGALETSAAEAFVLARLAETSDVEGEVAVAENEADDVVDVTISLSVPFAEILLFDQALATLWSGAPSHLTVDATMMKQ